LFRKAYGCSPRQFRQRAGPATDAEADSRAALEVSEPARPPASWPLDHGEPWAAAGWKSMARHDG
jgi:hypothetical protein